MRKVEIEEYKDLLLKEMKYLHDVCVDNNITYFLIYGSLLGAVRHNGFIPWDDDFDVVLPRDDYNKLVSIMQNNSSSRYKLLTYQTIGDYTSPLAKLIDSKTVLQQNYGLTEKVTLGVYIDVFVFDGLPNNKDDQIKTIKHARDLTTKWIYSNQTIRKDHIIKDSLKYIIRIPYHILGYKYFLKRIDEFAQRYSFYDSEFVTNLTYTRVDYAYYKEDFKPILHQFEKFEFYIPLGYDRFLTQRYGEWRTTPPHDEQQPHHDYECYYVE